MTTLTIDREYLTNTLADLVRINSINPTLIPGGAGEREISGYLTQAMRQLGMIVAQHEPESDRISTVGLLRGSGGGKSLMLNGHIDTVGVDYMPDPFSAEIRAGKLYGRGAYDMKGSIAAALAAVKALRDAGQTLPGFTHQPRSHRLFAGETAPAFRQRNGNAYLAPARCPCARLGPTDRQPHRHI